MAKKDLNYFKEYGTPFCLPRSKNQALAWDNLVNAMYSFLPTYAELSTLALDRFKWQFPTDNEQLDSDFCEILNFYKGRSAMVDTGDKGFLICDFYTKDKMYNIFGYPTEIQAVDMYNNNKVIGTFKSDKFVIIPNQFMWYPSNLTVLKYSVDIANLIEAMEQNIEAQKFPVVLQGTEEQKNALRIIADKIECGDKYIFLDKNYKLDDITSLQINAPFISKELDEMRTRKMCDCLTKLGVNNANIYKESGIAPDETNANNSLVQLNFKTFLNARLKAIKEIKKKFNIDVKLNYIEPTAPSNDDFTINEEVE